MNPSDKYDDRLITAVPLQGDEAIDRAIRPKKLADYVCLLYTSPSPRDS